MLKEIVLLDAQRIKKNLLRTIILNDHITPRPSSSKYNFSGVMQSNCLHGIKNYYSPHFYRLPLMLMSLRQK